MNRFFYSFLFYLSVPILLLRLWLRGRKAPAYRQRISQRFGLNLPEFKQGGIWLHAVSVGESIAAAPIVKALQKRYPNLPITVTCMTPTGSERIQALFAGSVQHCYLPYDLPCCAKRFLNKLQPTLAIVMETELWPNHIQRCKEMDIPVVLANARLSERSAKGYAKFHRLTAPMLANISLIAVQTEVEAQRFLALGAKANAVQVTGSIKFDLHIDAHLIEQAKNLRASWGAARPIWIAGSTHAGEDEIILAAHKQLLTEFPNALLILVPRHPERFNNVFELCQQQGLTTLRRSTGAQVTAEQQVLLGDTMGELLCLYACADIALVGGSLVEHGGHNPLEPAALGKPVLAGEHMFNFLAIAQQLKQAGALLNVSDSASIAATIAQLWRTPEQVQKMQAAGFSVLQNNQGALQRLLDAIEALKTA